MFEYGTIWGNNRKAKGLALSATPSHSVVQHTYDLTSWSGGWWFLSAATRTIIVITIVKMMVCTGWGEPTWACRCIYLFHPVLLSGGVTEGRSMAPVQSRRRRRDVHVHINVRRQRSWFGIGCWGWVGIGKNLEISRATPRWESLSSKPGAMNYYDQYLPILTNDSRLQ